MATNTRGQIIAEALSTVGRDELSTLAQGWLQRWLDSVAQSWDWPQLRTEMLGYELNGAAANGAGQQFGSGGTPTTGPASRVVQIYDNIWLYLADGSMHQKVPLIKFLRDPKDKLAVEGVNRGIPTQILAEKSNTSQGRFNLYVYPEPNQTYLLSVPYRFIPGALSSDSDVPWFPDDETMVMAVMYKAWSQVDGPASENALKCQQDLAALLSVHKMRNAGVSPNGDVVEMSSAFKRWNP